MTDLTMRITLESDTSFGRGDGVPGLVDQEIALDRYGCPFLHGRTLKGLLNEVCADLLYALREHQSVQSWQQAADTLFGKPGSDMGAQGSLWVGHGKLPDTLHQAIRYEVTRQGGWSRSEVIGSLTTIRQQTAMGAEGAPDPHTLRAIRVIVRGTPFEAHLTVQDEMDPAQKGLLAACVKGLRRAGTARNRGRGLIHAEIHLAGAEVVTDTWYLAHFAQEVQA